MKLKFIFPVIAAIIVTIISCKTNNNAGHDCSGTTITVTASNLAVGNITVNAPLGSNYTYSIDGSAFQASPIFNSLDGSAHTITAKNENGCTGTLNVSITGCGLAGSFGNDTGSQKMYAGTVMLPMGAIPDTINYSVTGTSIHIGFRRIEIPLNGVQDSADCNTYKLDSIIFAMGDTLRSPLSGAPGGFFKMWNIRAGATITFNTTGTMSRYNIAHANTNITTPIDLSTINSSMNFNLQGTFIVNP